MTGLPVLEVGGTHARASAVDPVSFRVTPAGWQALDSGGSAAEILDALARCAGQLGPAPVLAVAMPGPMDYAAGTGLFRGVGKFGALYGADVGQGLLERLPGLFDGVTFVNDAEAFGLGEWLTGAARGHDRAVAITLGTGVGSAFVAGGRIVRDGPSVPPGGHAHRLEIGGRPLEDTVSRRAILAAYGAPAGLDVKDIAARAAAGEAAASRVFDHALRELGAALAPWLARFGARVLVGGGGLAGSWPLIEPPLRRGLGGDGSEVVIRKSADPGAATAAGAAWYCREHPGPLPARRPRTSGGS